MSTTITRGIVADLADRVLGVRSAESNQVDDPCPASDTDAGTSCMARSIAEDNGDCTLGIHTTEVSPAAMHVALWVSA